MNILEHALISITDLLALCKAAHIEHPAIDKATILITKSPKFILIFILELVKNHYDVTQEQLVSESKNTPVVQCRRAYFCLARTQTSISLSEIGKLVERDHSTVHYSLKKMDEFEEVNDKEWSTYKTIRDKYEKEFKNISGI